MNLRRAAAVVALPSFFALVACTTQTDPSSGSGGDACSKYIDALSGYLMRCGSGLEESSEAKEQLRAQCTRSMAAPGQSGLADALATCASRVDAASCKSLEGLDCPAPKGTLADGAACGEGFQCQSAFCKKSSSQAGESDCGVCAPRVAAGGACDDSSECVEGLQCAQESSQDKGTCKAPALAKAGAECEPYRSKACDTGLVCNGSQANGTYTCQTPAKAGADCVADYACEGELVCAKGTCAAPADEGASCADTSCKAGLGCDPATDTCTKPKGVGLGGACDKTVSFCTEGYCKGSKTDFDPSTDKVVVTPGTCTAYLADGAACTSDVAPGGEEPAQCRESSECKNGVCTAVDPAACK